MVKDNILKAYLFVWPILLKFLATDIAWITSIKLHVYVPVCPFT